MNKPTTKRPTYNQQVILELVKKYDVGKRYIRMSITGDRSGLLSEKIKDDYNKLASAAKKAVEQKAKEI